MSPIRFQPTRRPAPQRFPLDETTDDFTVHYLDLTRETLRLTPEGTADLPGEPLTSSALIDLRFRAVEALPEGSRDVLLIAKRLGDGTRVTIS